MKTYEHAKHKHTVTAEDRETTKQAILLRSGWKLVPEAKIEEPAVVVESFETPKPKAKKQ